MLQHIFGGDRPAWYFRLMVHELAQPTPAISVVVNETARPVYEGLRKAVGAMIGLPRDHDLTRFAAHSIISQIVHYSHARMMITQLWPDFKMTPERLEQISGHITRFSFAGLRQMKKDHKALTGQRAHQELKQQRELKRREPHRRKKLSYDRREDVPVSVVLFRRRLMLLRLRPAGSRFCH